MSANPMKQPPSVQSELHRVEGVIRRDEDQAERPEEDRLKEVLDRENAKDAQRIEEDMRQALRSPNCRRIFQRLVSECGVFTSSFVGPKVTDSGIIPSDALMMARNEGSRVIGLFLIELIERAEPGSTLQMQREHVSDAKAQQERRAKILGGLDG